MIMKQRQKLGRTIHDDDTIPITKMQLRSHSLALCVRFRASCRRMDPNETGNRNNENIYYDEVEKSVKLLYVCVCVCVWRSVCVCVEEM